MWINMLKKLNYIFDRRQKVGLLIVGIAIVIGSFLETLSISAVLPLVNVVTNPSIIDKEGSMYHTVKEVFHIPNARMFIFIMAMGMMLAYVVKNLYLTLLYYMQYRFTANSQRKISQRLMECYMSQDYLFHVSHNVAELQRNCGSDVSACFGVILNIIQLATEVMTCVFLVFFLAMQDFGTTIVILVLMLIFLFLVVFVFKRKLTKIGAQQRVYNMELNKWFLQSFQGIKEIKVANREWYFLDHYDMNRRESIKLGIKSSLIQIIPRPAMETICISGLLIYIGIRIWMGEEMTNFIPIISVFAVAAVRMLPSFNRISGCFAIISSSQASVNGVYTDLKEIEGLRQEVERDNKDTTVIPLDKGVFVKDMTFYYPNIPDVIVLDNVSLEIPKNRSIAFIGPSGAGKTTLADVILGVLKPMDGHVYADDIDIYEHLHAWHKLVGYIPQNIYLMDDTIRANVAFGYSKEDTDDEKVWKALEEAQLADFIKRQGMDLDSNIGAMGVKLSGGQRQRVGIARALYGEPQVLILDEATSALDTETETAVMESIDRLSGTKTMIIIAHRLTTIRNCDIVYEIRKGKVVRREKSEVMEEAVAQARGDSSPAIEKSAVSK